MCHLPPASYEERLSRLNLQRLELRRIHSDLLLLFKITHSMVHSKLMQNIHFTDGASSITRGNRFKIFVTRTRKQVLSTFFTHRVVPIWNFLPDKCFTGDSLYCFKHQIDSIDFSKFLKGRV